MTINLQERCVDVESSVCLHRGELELVACTKGTKEHESIVMMEAKPMHLHAALLLLGAKPGSPATREQLGDQAVCAEHSERIHHLVEAGVDLLLIETMTFVREAVIAAELAMTTGRPTWVGFVCDSEGRILSGESVKVAAEVLMPLGVNALGVNCGPAHTLAKPLAELRSFCDPDFPLIAYGNIGYADEKAGWVNTDAMDPERYLQ